METTVTEQEKHAALDKEYRVYIEGLRSEWLGQNRVRSNVVYEVMHPEQQAEVRQRGEQWGEYITPFAEAWWAARGYGVVWPEDDSQPMKVYKLKVT